MKWQKPGGQALIMSIFKNQMGYSQGICSTNHVHKTEFLENGYVKKPEVVEVAKMCKRWR